MNFLLYSFFFFSELWLSFLSDGGREEHFPATGPGARHGGQGGVLSDWPALSPLGSLREEGKEPVELVPSLSRSDCIARS